MITAHEISIDTDEGRYVMLVEGEDGAGGVRLNIDIHNCVLKFYERVQAEIRPYVLEADSARRAVDAGMTREEYLDTHHRLDHPELVTNRPISVEDAVEAGYALDDPKSPGYHDRMVGDN